jgi:hypothetical protein
MSILCRLPLCGRSVGKRRLGDGDSVSPLRFLPVEDHLAVFLKSTEAALQGVQYQFSRCRGMTSLLCPFDHTTLASDTLLKLRDVLIGFGEVLSFVEHGVSLKGSILFAHYQPLALVFR